MFVDWMWPSWEEAGLVALSALVLIVGVLTSIRLVGLRSLSKMSSFDFTVTVAIGSIMATTVVTNTPAALGVVAVAALLAVQAAIAVLRRSTSFERLVDNTPRLLMRDGVFIDRALNDCRVTRSDVLAKLREANVSSLSDVHAVVLETTGDISVVHGSHCVDEELFGGVDMSR
ncbi:MAG: DUF421 domain-containing protein [Ilumatobacter sp.]|jgi:uncharacterized membrane protein YcaP (DUF421 family)|uniref:DUF421 domain-containing protein n=1 Tax=Ilumatobacter sp. TaxID=1967498 RepID=UPI00391A4783